MQLREAKHIHCIGIGGAGMSALAQLLQSQGREVSGCDREEGPTIALLRKRGIAVSIGHDAGHCTRGVDSIVYSAAIPEDHSERVQARLLGILGMNYFEALGEISRGMYTIAISGTHGKTTTTGMVANILIDAGLSPTVVAGGILKNFGGNFITGKPVETASGMKHFFVVEACEYRRHFLHLHPSVLVITNLELDHPDYYKDLADVQDAFAAFVRSVPESGVVVTKSSDGHIMPILRGSSCAVVDYTKEQVSRLKLPGSHNRANAQAAKAACKAMGLGISEESIDNALVSFEGTWRRFDYKGKTKNGALVYDDYAHHPTAIRVTLQTARDLFSAKRIVVLFHPHLYSRTKALFNDFAASFADADEVLLLPIYAAREAHDPSVSSETLARAIESKGVHARPVGTFVEAVEILNRQESGVLVFTMGAGDVYKVAETLTIEMKN